MGHLCIVSVSRKRDNSGYGRGSVHQSSEKCLKLSKAWWAHSCALCIQVIFNRHQTAHYKPSIHDSTFKHCVLHMSNHVKPMGPCRSVLSAGISRQGADMWRSPILSWDYFGTHVPMDPAPTSSASITAGAPHSYHGLYAKWVWCVKAERPSKS